MARAGAHVACQTERRKKEEEREREREREREKAPYVCLEKKERERSVLGITGLERTSTVESITWFLARESKTEAATDRKEYVCRCTVSTGDRFFQNISQKRSMKET